MQLTWCPGYTTQLYSDQIFSMAQTLQHNSHLQRYQKDEKVILLLQVTVKVGQKQMKGTNSLVGLTSNLSAEAYGSYNVSLRQETSSCLGVQRSNTNPPTIYT